MTLRDLWLTAEINTVLLTAIAAFFFCLWLAFVGSIKAWRYWRGRHRRKYAACAHCGASTSSAFLKAMQDPLPAFLRPQAGPIRDYVDPIQHKEIAYDE